MTRISANKLKAKLKKLAKVKPPSDKKIDFSDIPALTDEQLKSARRVGPGRPPYGPVARKLISLKVDTSVLEQLRAEAKTKDMGYQTLIHEVLEEHVSGRSHSDRAAKDR